MHDYEMSCLDDGSIAVRYGRHPLLSDQDHDRIRHEIREHLAAGARRVVFDWRSIRYLPSDAIGFLLSVVLEIRQGGGEPLLLLTRLPRLEKVASVTSLARAVPIDWTPA